MSGLQALGWLFLPEESHEEAAKTNHEENRETRKNGKAHTPRTKQGKTQGVTKELLGAEENGERAIPDP